MLVSVLNGVLASWKESFSTLSPDLYTNAECQGGLNISKGDRIVWKYLI